MGRPPLGYKMINVRFPPELLERMDKVVGTHRRPDFIREAVENAVRIAEITAKHARKTESE